MITIKEASLSNDRSGSGKTLTADDSYDNEIEKESTHGEIKAGESVQACAEHSDSNGNVSVENLKKENVDETHGLNPRDETSDERKSSARSSSSNLNNES